MGIIKEFMCHGHGIFETDKVPARCPYGCKTIFRYFSSPPNVGNGVAKRVDRIANAQMRSMGLTDMSNSQGRSVMQNLKRKMWGSDAPGGDAPDMRPRTIDINPGSGLAANLGMVNVPVEDRSASVGGTRTLATRTKSYADPRGDPKV